MNGIVVGLGALLLGVPLAGPIAIVTFVTSYIPFFGAFFAGAFAVVVALGAKGLSVALAMLAITLLANNTLQNLLEPVAFGRTLRLHSLVVLLVTTAGTLLFGMLGATLAAPVTAVTLRTIALLRSVGLFDAADAVPAWAGEIPLPQEGRETSAGPGRGSISSLSPACGSVFGAWSSSATTAIGTGLWRCVRSCWTSTGPTWTGTPRR